MSDINDSNYVSDDKSADISKVILSEVNEAAVCCVSTLAGDHIKNRMMHFAVTPDFRFYLTSMKDDPKTKQLALCPRISILAHIAGGGFTEAKEMEVAGRGEIIEDENGRRKAIGLLMDRSPVVAQMAQYGKLGLLSFIEVVPQSIKFRRVKDILQGIKPTIIDFGRTTSAIGDDMARLRRKIGAWVAETRYPFLMVTAIPVVLGASVAWMRQGIFKPLYFILTLAGAACLHLGANIINDYFDHKSGNDEANTQFVRPFSGGSRVIQNGLLTPLEVLAGAAAFFALGSAIGIFLTYKIGWPILILGIIGVVSGVFYTAPVLSWAKRGIGESLVGVNFGVLVALG
ncbi:MAG: prenyltransferase, partial [Endomicrobiia bacterium]|nr:prenyltransferase [Endomicrobiia bacterium]